MKKNSANGHRFFLGLIVLCVGLASINSMPARGNRLLSGSMPRQDIQTVAPQPYKYIGKYRGFPNEPIEITNIKIKGKQVNINNKVREGEDWLNGIAFKVKNTSEKRMVYLSLEILFPETKSDAPILAYPLRYGVDSKLSNQTGEHKSLNPSEEVAFSVSSIQYEKLKRFIEKRTPIANINAATIDVVLIVFDDDTAWATGAFMHRSPKDPTKWVDND